MNIIEEKEKEAIQLIGKVDDKWKQLYEYTRKTSHPHIFRLMWELKNDFDLLSKDIKEIIDGNICKYFKEPDWCNILNDNCQVFHKKCGLRKETELKEIERKQVEEIDKKIENGVKGFINIFGYKKQKKD